MYFLLPAGLFSLTLATGIFLSSSNINAETVTANASVIVPAACTFSSTLDSAHSAEINNNTYRTDIGATTFIVICNDTEGFSLYAVGYANEEFGNTKLLATIGGVLTPAKDIVTGTAESGSTSNWAMKLQTVSGQASPTIESGFSTYHSVPNVYTKVATLTNATSISGVSVQSTYAAFISGTQPAGTYNGKVKYTMVHPADETPLQPQTCPSGKICYFPNGSNVVGTMGQQTVSSSATSAKLLASNFSRTGYGFAGWSDSYDYASNPNANFYGSNEDIAFTAGQYTGSNSGLSLYAVWVKSQGDFQDASETRTICNGLTQASASGTRTLASVSALTDTRDNQTYAIARLADGNCWMIENLRLDNTAQLTILNTNNPLNDGTDVTLKHNYTDAQTYNTLSASSNVAYDADTAPDGWCNSATAVCNDQSRLRTDNTANRVSYASGATMSANANLYSYGNYYNWYSATAGHGTHGKSSGNTDGDLCPVGWHLPTGTSSGDFYYLNAYVNAGSTSSDANLRIFPNNFVHSGNAYSASLNNRGTQGLYWSSTAYSSSDAYRLDFSSTYVSNAAYGNFKYFGRTIRCLVSLIGD